MAVYTSYDMIRDCQAGRAEGWLYLVDAFVPAITTIAKHYGGGDAELRQILTRLREKDGPLMTMEPCHQREFLYQLRPLILECTGTDVKANKDTPDLEAILTALAPLSATERQAAWLESFRYDATEIAVIMRMAPDTVAKLRQRVAELLRGGLDTWSAGMLATHGAALGAELETMPTTEPMEFRHFLDVMDGRVTWQRRTGFERQLEGSWPEVHKACRIREADQALAAKPAGDMSSYLTLLNVARPKPGLLKSLFSR